MSITCPVCKYDANPDGVKFCEACGSELIPVSPRQPPIDEDTFEDDFIDFEESKMDYPTTTLQPPEAFEMDYPATTLQPPEVATATSGKLIAKQGGVPVTEFPLDGTNQIIGRFDLDSGPVDIDLDGFPGDDTISRHHAEIYREGGYWKIKDLGSTNGVFIRRAAQSRFEARITLPEIIHPGDEIAIAKVRFLFQSP